MPALTKRRRSRGGFTSAPEAGPGTSRSGKARGRLNVLVLQGAFRRRVLRPAGEFPTPCKPTPRHLVCRAPRASVRRPLGYAYGAHSASGDNATPRTRRRAVRELILFETVQGRCESRDGWQSASAQNAASRPPIAPLFGGKGIRCPQHPRAQAHSRPWTDRHL